MAVLLLLLVVLEHLRAVAGVVPGAVYAATAVGLLAAALFLRAWASVHLCLFLVLAIAATRLPWEPLLVTALQFPLLFATSLLLLPFDPVRAAARSWWRRGRFDRISLLFTLGTPPAAGVALIVWALWTDQLGAGLAMMQGVASLPWWLLVLIALPLFAVLNALAEELVFRGLLQQALDEALGDRPLVVLPLQAAAFAALHFAAGFPNGVVGYGMVFVWGMVLGFLRRRTGGLLSPYLVHVAADLVIVYFLYSRV